MTLVLVFITDFNLGYCPKHHGLLNGYGFICKFHRWYDHTAGCIAVTNDEIEELYNAVDVGTKIEIKP